MGALGKRLLELTDEYRQAVDHRDPAHAIYGVGHYSSREPDDIADDAEAVVREIARG